MDDPLNTALQTIFETLPAVDQAEYETWIARAEQGLRSPALANLRSPNLRSWPSLSICIAAGAPLAALNDTLRSLDQQVTANFDVVLGCPSSHYPEVQAAADQFANLKVEVAVVRPDHRNDVVTLEQWVLTHARGDFVAFLAAGDLLANDACAEIGWALSNNPEVDVVYTDEDWINSFGVRSRPSFRASWDPDAQWGFDLMGRFTPIRRELATDLGLRHRFGLAAHYDLHCRAAEAAGLMGIMHLPYVLRHAAKQAAPSALLAEEYAAQARKVAAESAWRSEGLRPSVTAAPLAPWFNKIRWPLPAILPLVSILVPTRDRADILRVAVSGVLERTSYRNFELLILDNDSVEESTFALFAELSRDPRIRIVSAPGPFNYSKINNLGAQSATGDIFLLLNNDVDVIHPDWLHELVSNALRPEIGCVGAKLLYGDGRIQHAGVSMSPHSGCAHVGRLSGKDAPGIHGCLAITTTLSAVTAACLCLRKTVFEEIGGLDEENLKVGYNDVDLCLNATDHGYRNIVSPFCRLFHLESVSRGANDNLVKQTRERLEQGRVIARYRDVFLADPHRSPNLNLAWDGEPRLVVPVDAIGR